MQSTATIGPHPANDIDAGGIPLTPKVRARRKLNRRGMLIAMGLSFLFDAALFTAYALAGSTSLATPVLYATCGMLGYGLVRPIPNPGG